MNVGTVGAIEVNENLYLVTLDGTGIGFVAGGARQWTLCDGSNDPGKHGGVLGNVIGHVDRPPGGTEKQSRSLEYAALKVVLHHVHPA